CALCLLGDDDPAVFGEKVVLRDHGFSIHYFCLLMSCGVYQRGEEDEGVFGFLVDDIKREIRRSARLTCCLCKMKGASVGCNVKSCRKTVHFPCSRKMGFISQFTGLFPSYCPDHCPAQTLCVSSELSLPQSCSICLDAIQPVLGHALLKCPCCHSSWFHRDCVQHQAHSAGLFFFRCTLCNNKERFQAEMLRMGIFIPERDASWELEADAYSDLLEVYRRCDAEECLCSHGRAHSAKTGWFEVIRCRLCGSRGTHRRCSRLRAGTRAWACTDCTQATDGKGLPHPAASSSAELSFVSPPGHTSSGQPEEKPAGQVSAERPSTHQLQETSEDILRALARQLRPLGVQLEVGGAQALAAGLELVRRSDFDPAHTLNVSFKDVRQTSFPSSHLGGEAARQHFLELLMQQIQDSEVFEGPDGCRNLALDSRALRDDLYYDVGCLLALCLVHRGPPVSFFSPALYQCLFNYPANQPLAVGHMTPSTYFTCHVNKVAEAESVEELKAAAGACGAYLELAGCSAVSSLQEKEALVEDLVTFALITRMQLPLQRFREGLRTLGVFDQVQLSPATFFSVFCRVSAQLTAPTLSRFFTVNFSEDQERLAKEMSIVSFWRHLLLECEAGRSSVSLQDLLHFATGAREPPASGFLPPPSISFLHPAASSQRELGSKHLLLPVTSSYQAFKGSMEQAVSRHVHLLPSEK
uniref:G2/M-phase specific E3 ubiquitin protein ligase n=1 Tax=Tetraodon nigroviridis TaxID=99883 RepID=H3CA88_TETNG